MCPKCVEGEGDVEQRRGAKSKTWRKRHAEKDVEREKKTWKERVMFSEGEIDLQSGWCVARERERQRCGKRGRCG